MVTAVDGKPKAAARLARLRHLQLDPRVSLLADHYESDWTRLWWVRIDGTATIHARGKAFQQGMGLLMERYPQYRSVALPGPLIRITPTTIRGWRASLVGR